MKSIMKCMEINEVSCWAVIHHSPRIFPLAHVLGGGGVKEAGRRRMITCSSPLISSGESVAR